MNLQNIENSFEIKPEFLLCNHAGNPLGIGTLKPSFSWRAAACGRGKAQSAYRILVADSLEHLQEEQKLLWDTGKVQSNECTSVTYQGGGLKTAETYYWKVKIWDEAGKESLFSYPAIFETALAESDWKAVWIGNPTVETTYHSMAPMFRKMFEVTKPVQKARVYVAGLGYYELRLNGHKVGDHVLDPGWTDYAKRVLYATYDVTDDLQCGTNVIGAIVGVGWHRIPKLRLQLHISYSDGTSETVSTSPDSGWLVTIEGPIRQNGIYNGETYDARCEIEGWDTASYNPEADSSSAHRWRMAIELEGPGGRMEAQELEPIKVVDELRPVAETEPCPGVHVYDIGQNIAGWARIRVRGERGMEVTLKFAEFLQEDGTVNQINLRSAKATDTYVLKGGSEESYEPKFTYHGFRYVQVETSTGGHAELSNLAACVVRSSVAQSGEFECSNELINRIHQNVVWTEADNMHSVPTDCPQRDERMGWLNDLTVRSEEAVYNFNLSRFYTKYVQDIEDTQGEESGAISDTAPSGRYGCKPADPVSTSFLLLPWLLFVNYGDKNILAKHYEGIKKWAAYLERHTQNHIVTYSYYGDWASPVSQSVEGSLGAGAESANTPGILMSTGYHYFNSLLLARIARILGHTDDAERYEKLIQDIAQAFHKHFYDPEKRQYASGSQGAQVFPLFLGIVPEQEKAAVLQNLVKDVMEANEGHLTTGNLCSRYIMDVLVDNGLMDVAYTLATQTTYPSWGYMIANGATTIWERWEYVTEGPLVAMASHNHPMYGAVDAWFYKMLAGIQADPEGPGFAKFSVKPHVPEQLTYARGVLQTVRGEAGVHWERNNAFFLMQVTVPWNSEATVQVPLLNQSPESVTVKEGENIIWAQGSYIEGTQGISGGRQLEKGYITFTAGSGCYDFVIEI